MPYNPYVPDPRLAQMYPWLNSGFAGGTKSMPMMVPGRTPILTAPPAAGTDTGAGPLPYSWGGYGGQKTQFNTLDEALGAIAQNHTDLAGQRVNLYDKSRFPELFKDGYYIGPNPSSNYQSDATYNEDPLWAQRFARAGRDPNEALNALKAAGLPAYYSGPMNGGYMLNGHPLSGASETDFNNMFSLTLPTVPAGGFQTKGGLQLSPSPVGGEPPPPPASSNPAGRAPSMPAATNPNAPPAGTPVMTGGNPAGRGPGLSFPNGHYGGRPNGFPTPAGADFPYNPNPPAPPGTWGDLYSSLFDGTLNPNESRNFGRTGLDPRLDSTFSYAMQEALSRYADPNGATFFSGPTVAGFTDPELQSQQQVLSQTDQMKTGTGLDYINTLLSRAKDPSSDPTIQAAIDAMSKDATQQFTDPNGPLASLRSESINNGAYGGTRQGVMEGVLQGRLADAIAKNSAMMRLQGRDQNLSAAGSALTQMNPAITAAVSPALLKGDVGAQQRAMTQSTMDDTLKRWFYNTTMPDQRLSNLYSLLGATPLGGYTGGQNFVGSDLIQRVGSPTMAQNIAGGLAGAAALYQLFKNGVPTA